MLVIHVEVRHCTRLYSLQLWLVLLQLMCCSAAVDSMLCLPLIWLGVLVSATIAVQAMLRLDIFFGLVTRACLDKLRIIVTVCLTIDFARFESIR